MKNKTLKTISKTVIILASLFFVTPSFGQKIKSKKTSISFYSHTAIEDIKSQNTASVSVLDPSTGEIVFSVPMQSFEFEKALMQKHFNSKDFLNTKKNPKAKLVGKITNLSSVNFKKDGTYSANISGDMTINGKTQSFTDKGTIIVKGDKISIESKFNIKLADYGIAFKKGKPSTNIAKSIETTVQAQY